jgi:hypothetical protein
MMNLLNNISIPVSLCDIAATYNQLVIFNNKQPNVFTFWKCTSSVCVPPSATNVAHNSVVRSGCHLWLCYWWLPTGMRLVGCVPLKRHQPPFPNATISFFYILSDDVICYWRKKKWKKSLMIKCLSISWLWQSRYTKSIKGILAMWVLWFLSFYFTLEN